MSERARMLVDAAATDEARRKLRRNSLALADALTREEGPEAGLDFLRTLFARGVFDSPPISGEAYDAWRRLAAAAPPPPVPAEGPLVSLLMPVYDPRPEHLRAALDSVLAQTWARWELCIADDASTRADIRPLLEDYARRDARLRLVFRPENGHICAAANSALELASGEWCALLDQDDLLPPEALAVVVAAIAGRPDAHVFFSDEDQFCEKDGRRVHLNPLFKPGLDPDLLLCCNCVNHLGVYRTTSLRALNGFRPGFEGSQDYDLVLRMLARHGEGAFVHIPRVLYHWRRHEGSTSADWAAKPYARATAQRARTDYAAAVGLRAEFPQPETSTHARPRFLPPRRSPLTTVALLADAAPVPQLLERWPQWLSFCGLEQREILAVGPAALLDALRPLAESLGARLVSAPSADIFVLANRALHAARGDVLCFQRVNDAPLTAGWAALACGALLRPGVAAVGGRSLSPHGFFHHAGYAVGLQRTARGDAPMLCPAFHGLHQQAGGYFNWAHLPHSAPAVRLDGLCCLRAPLEKLGGFDPRAALWADADFCFAARTRLGLRSLVLPLDVLSPQPTAPIAASPLLRERWGDLLAAPPFQNPSLLWTPGGWRLRPPSPPEQA